MMASPTSAHPVPTSTLQDLQQKITDQVECAICQEDCTNPKTLPCCHVYCLDCLKLVVNRARKVNKNAESIECPQCRKEAKIPHESEGGVAGFPTAFHITNLMEIRTAMQSTRQLPSFGCGQCGSQSVAIAFCQTCSMFICRFCNEVHAKWDMYSDHEVIGLDESGLLPTESENETCREHAPQRLNYFCESCDLLLCQTCHDSDIHRNHRRKSLTATVHQCKDTIASCLLPLKEQQSSLGLATLRVDTKSSHIKQQAEDIKSQIDTDINRILKALEHRRETLKKDADEIAEGKLKALSSQRKALDEVQSQVSSYVSVVEQCLTKGSNRRVITMRKAVQKRVEEISTLYYNRSRVLPVEEADLVFLPTERLLEQASTYGCVASSTVCPSHCQVSGDGLDTATIGEASSVTVTTFDKDRGLCGENLPLLSLELVSLAGGCKQVGKLEKQVKNQHTLSYIPVTKGKNKLHLKINGEDAGGSPFSVTVYPPLRFYGTHVRSIAGLTLASFSPFAVKSGNEAKLSRPWGLTVNGQGDLVVIDNTGWMGVHIFKKDTATEVAAFSDTAAYSPLTAIMGVSDGQCYEPRGVATDADDNILVVDGKAHRVQLFSPSGSFLKAVGSQGKAPLQFFDPVGIAVSRQTNKVYVCDRRNNRIQVLSADLSFIREFGRYGEGPGDLYFPWDVDLDSHGNVFVADCGHCCIKVFTSEGRYLRSIGCQGTENGQFQHLSSICIDKDDFLYAADKENNCVSVFHPRGDFVMQFGTPGKTPGQMQWPLGVAVGNDGLVYVSDSYNQRVQVFR